MKYGLWLILLSTVLLLGCASHFKYVRIVDSVTGQVYYARYATQSRLGLNFKDAQTGAMISLQSAEMRQMTEEQFEQALAGSGR